MQSDYFGAAAERTTPRFIRDPILPHRLGLHARFRNATRSPPMHPLMAARRTTTTTTPPLPGMHPSMPTVDLRQMVHLSFAPLAPPATQDSNTSGVTSEDMPTFAPSFAIAAKASHVVTSCLDTGANVASSCNWMAPVKVKSPQQKANRRPKLLSRVEPLLQPNLAGQKAPPKQPKLRQPLPIAPMDLAMLLVQTVPQ